MAEECCSHEHQHASAPLELPFSPAEVESFRADDKRTAAVIVYLMVGIFTLGLVGYFAVALWVA